MQPNFTRKKTESFIRKIPLLLFFCSLFYVNAGAQTYVNGVLSTGATSLSGVAAPAGTTWSECQNPTGDLTIANTLAGAGAQITANNTVADDFTVPAGPDWAVSKITVYAYSTGYAGTTSPFNDVRIRIHNSNPMAGPTTVVFGDLTTNRLSASSFTNIYRIFNSVVTPATAPGTTRKIWKLEANVSVTLPPGTYWLEFQTGASVTSNFVPLSSPLGVRTLPGYNAIQSLSGTWGLLQDDGQGPASPAPVATALPFSIDYTTGACAGTPTPGNTIASVSTVCPATSFTLSLQNATAGSGVTYQWESSPDNTTWSPIAGATSSSYSTTLAASTWYRAVVTCSGNPPATSTPVQVMLNPPSSCYCIPPSTDCSDNDVILRVQLNTLDNSSTCSPGGYANYTSSVAATDLIAGAPNRITVTAAPNWSKAVAVWVDYNQNGQFETSEYAHIGSGPGGTSVISNVFNVPAGATLGTTRMRVRLRFGTTAFASTAACTNPSSFGETEDYAVNIVPCVPAQFTTHPSGTTIQCGSNASFTATASGSIPTFTWQMRPNSGAVWSTVTNGGIYSGATTATLALTNVPGDMNGYQFRALMTGACSAVDFSNIATLTVSPIIATVAPTSAIICNGDIQALTLTNASSPTTAVFNSTGSTPIPDASAAGTTNTIAVSGIPAGAVVTNISATLNISHTWVGDLDINLVGPNGENMNLVGGLDNGSGSNGTSDFVNTVISSTSSNPISGAPAPRTGTFAAEARAGYGTTTYTQTVNTWAALSTVLNGDWKLAVADYGNLDVGTINSWSISITYGAAAAGVWSPTTGLYTDPAATVPYTGTAATTVYAKPTVTTNYSVVYTTATPCTSNPTVIPVTVANLATDLEVTPATRAVCIDGNTSFTATTTGGNPLTYQWEVSDDGGATWTEVSGATSATLSLANVTSAMSGNMYRVIATAGPCGDVTSASFGTLTVNPEPTVTLAASALQITPGQTTNIVATSNPAAADYSWTLNGSNIPGANTGTVIANIDGLGAYQVTVTDVNGCVGTSEALSIGGAASDYLWIYPNPTSGQFQVRLYSTGNPTDVRVVSLFTNTGQLVDRKKFTLTNANGPYLRMDFDLTKAPAGTYVVKVEDRYNKVITSGFVVKQ